MLYSVKPLRLSASRTTWCSSLSDAGAPPRQTGWVLRRRVIPIALLALTALATIVIFWMFDRDSHSASDTLRPFLITVAPVWLIVGLAVHRLTHTPTGT
jgi:hypothetical protein